MATCQKRCPINLLEQREHVPSYWCSCFYANKLSAWTWCACGRVFCPDWRRDWTQLPRLIRLHLFFPLFPRGWAGAEPCQLVPSGGKVNLHSLRFLKGKHHEKQVNCTDYHDCGTTKKKTVYRTRITYEPLNVLALKSHGLMSMINCIQQHIIASHSHYCSPYQNSKQIFKEIALTLAYYQLTSLWGGSLLGSHA